MARSKGSEWVAPSERGVANDDSWLWARNIGIKFGIMVGDDDKIYGSIHLDFLVPA